MTSIRKSCAVLLLAAALFAGPVAAAYAAGEPPVALGTSASYALLTGLAIGNTGATSVTGDLGVYPGNSVEPGIVVNGTSNLGNAAAQQALADFRTAYLDAESRTPGTTLSGNLGGLTLLPGVYRDSGAGPFLINGTLTLDAQGDPNAVWVIQTSSDLHVMDNAVVNLVNGARFCRVFWAVGDEASLGVNAQFQGHVLAFRAITTDGPGATVRGQLLSGGGLENNGILSLNASRIDNSICTTWTPGLPKTGYPPKSAPAPAWRVASALGAILAMLALATGPRTREGSRR